MGMEVGQNQAALVGRVEGTPRWSHMNHGVDYYIFPLAVERLSGAEDIPNVVVSQALLDACPLAEGMTCRVEGEVRSFNNRSGVGRRLVISFFARSLAPAEGPHENELELTGVLCKPPVVRRTPLGREIADLLLAVNRRYGRSDYLPCIAWGAMARLAGELGVGDAVHLTGRLQSRKYRKVIDGVEEERTAYEISVLNLEPKV